MFVVVGENLKQWEQGRCLKNEHMVVGDAVKLLNGSGESFTMYAYEKGGAVVVDVPNDLLQRDGVLTAYLIMNNDCRTNLYVEAQEKPADYVYENNTIPSDEKIIIVPGGDGGVVDIDLKAKGMPRIPLDGTPATITNAELVKELVECAENGKTLRVFLEGGDEYMTLGFFVTGIANKIIDVTGVGSYNLSVMMVLEGMPFFVAIGFDNTEMIACNVMIMGA